MPRAQIADTEEERFVFHGGLVNEIVSSTPAFNVGLISYKKLMSLLADSDYSVFESMPSSVESRFLYALEVLSSL